MPAFRRKPIVGVILIFIATFNRGEFGSPAFTFFFYPVAGKKVNRMLLESYAGTKGVRCR
jgi:hypothetical protein